MVKVKETGLTLASSAYEALRQDIMEGRIPPGEKLQFDALRERYDVGISPIRSSPISPNSQPSYISISKSLANF